MHKVKVFVLLGFLLAVFSSNVNACDCITSGKPCHDYWGAAAVFTGTVVYSSRINIKRGEYEDTQRLVRFNIEQAFRGVRADEVEVMTGLGESDCGYGFQLGGRYLVYAYEDGDKLSTSICSRTRPLSEAADDLAYFRGLTTAKPGAIISGDVKRIDRATPESGPRPVSGVKIFIQGPFQSVEAVTDKQGAYRVSGLAPGTYKVRIDLPDGLSTDNPEEQAKVFDRGCAQVSFWVDTDTRITGKVIDAQGQPAADVLMELVPSEGQSSISQTYVRTDKDGRYEMRMLQPGRYLFGVRIYGSAGATYVPYPRTYYPGGREADGAMVINLANGQRLELHDLILPSRFVERKLNGIVVDAKGRPVSGAVVWLKENEYADHDMPYRQETDSEGRFSFKVYEGLNYDLKAYVDEDKEERKQAVHSVRVSSDSETIRLVLP